MSRLSMRTRSVSDNRRSASEAVSVGTGYEPDVAANGDAPDVGKLASSVDKQLIVTIITIIIKIIKITIITITIKITKITIINIIIKITKITVITIIIINITIITIITIIIMSKQLSNASSFRRCGDKPIATLCIRWSVSALVDSNYCKYGVSGCISQPARGLSLIIAVDG